ncbi:nitroreductase [Flavobacteriaceae bacterium MAR_2010_105]|nr:nitroreductase [Flavobacteriaceae bacterium MAR_2010_105]
MDIINHLQWRYATKKFDAEKLLSAKKMDTLKKAFNLTATSFGLQTISMVIISDKAMREPLLQHSYYQKQVVDASHLLMICIQENITDTDVDLLFDNTKSIRKTPEHILAPYRKDLKQLMKEMTIAERQEWSVKQAYIALGNLMTVCAVEGIDSCPMEGFSSDDFDRIFNLKEKNLKSVLLLPVGYRSEDDMFADFKKVRKHITQSIIEL